MLEWAAFADEQKKPKKPLSLAQKASLSAVEKKGKVQGHSQAVVRLYKSDMDHKK
jgi:hypothetical protein